MSDEIVRQTPELAEQDEAARASEDVREFLGFTLAGESYAFPLATVQEIVKPLPITEVPRSRHEILGVMSVRGRMTTVVDLRRLLRVHESPFDRLTRILLVDTGDEVQGCAVDRVLQVYRMSSDEMELATVMGGDTSEHVIGVGRPRGGRGVGRGREAAQGERGGLVVLVDPVVLLRR